MLPATSVAFTIEFTLAVSGALQLKVLPVKIAGVPSQVMPASPERLSVTVPLTEAGEV